MPTLDNDVLRSWPDLWRHPLLFVDVLRGHDVDAAVVARRLAASMVTLADPKDAFGMLLEWREFDAATEMLLSDTFHSILSAEDLQGLEAELERTRSRAEEELQAEYRSSMDRAAKIGLAMDAVSLVALPRYCDRREAVAARARAVEAAESFRLDELANRLARVKLEQRRDPERDEWLQNIADSLRARDWEVASWLLDLGHAPSGADGEDTVRLPSWPYRDPAATILEWCHGTRQQPRGFERWRPTADDRPAWRMLDALAAVPANGDVDRACAETLIAALAEFVGAQATAVGEVDGGYRTVLRQLSTPGFPALGRERVGGIPLGIPNSLRGDMAFDVGDAPVGLVFHPGGVTSALRGPAMLHADATLLFAIMAQPERRKRRFCRWIGRDIPIARAIPAPPALPDPTTALGIQDLLSRCVDDARPLAVSWCSGHGRTTFLMALADALHTNGFAPHWLCAGNADAWTPPVERRALVVIDDVHRAGSDHQQAALRAVLQWRDVDPDNRRVAVAGSPPCRALVESIWRGALVLDEECRAATQNMVRIVTLMLDYVDVKFDSAVTTQRFVYYTSGNFLLVLRLAWELLKNRPCGRDRPRATITMAEVQQAWMAPEFQYAATESALHGLDGYPDVVKLLGSFMYAKPPGPERSWESVADDDIITAWGFLCAGEDLSTARLQELLAAAVDLQLLRRTDAKGYRLSRSGIGLLLQRAFEDPEERLEIMRREGKI